jgi:catechol-2,3-dioxygenase
LTVLGDFYAQTLGLEVVKREAGRIWLRAGEVVLMLEITGEGEPPIDPQTRELVAFAVEPAEREAWAARLEAAGITIEDRTAHTLYFRDPDGRRIAVSSYPFC